MTENDTTPKPAWEDQWPAPTAEEPDIEDIIEWHDEAGGCEATDGCWVEPDGVCQHGYPSWLLYRLMI
jgi:hypothetical protein